VGREDERVVVGGAAEELVPGRAGLGRVPAGAAVGLRLDDLQRGVHQVADEFRRPRPEKVTGETLDLARPPVRTDATLGWQR